MIIMQDLSGFFTESDKKIF